MRSKRGSGVSKLLSMLLVCIMLIECSGVFEIPAKIVQAEELMQEETAAWDGVTREKTWELDRCKVVYNLTDAWEDGYTASVVVENTSDSVIENWHVSFPVEQEIVDVWNVQVIETADATTVFKNLGWNQDIAVGQSVNFGFTAKGAFNGFPDICELPASRRECAESDYEITYAVTDAWDTGHVVQMCIKNNTERTIEDWFVSFDCDYAISDIWNGQILSWEEGRYTVKNSDYNQNITAGEEVYIGFTVNGPADAGISGCRLEEIALGESDASDSDVTSGDVSEGDVSEGDVTDGDVSNGDVTEGDVSNGDITGGDVSGSDVTDGDISVGDLESVCLTIETDSFDYNEAAEYYLNQLRVERINGTLSGAEQVESLRFEVTDLYELVVDSGELAAEADWSIAPIGLVLGYNLITVTAVCKDGEEVSETLFIMNFNEENMADADVDLSDTDEDGINNYSEFVLGLNPYLADSDGDGMEDLVEMSQVGTSPIMIDTDENGVNDGEEDLDEDGLTNLEEVQLGTDARFEDSDGDKLLDGEEVNRYGTDPMVPDHDEDGLLDGEDVLMGFEPLNPDTDGDGILDGDEVVYQTCVEELDQERAAGITQVAVSMDCAGFIENEVSIFNVYNLDMRTTDVVGLVGAPVEIETEQAFDEATIVFTYDEAALGETSEDNLRIMWYDEENDEYILLDEETVIDKENNTLSCTTNHFSVWLVVDVLRWLEAMSTIGYEANFYNCEVEINYAEAHYDAMIYNKLPSGEYASLYGSSKFSYIQRDDMWRWEGYGIMRPYRSTLDANANLDVLIDYVKKLEQNDIPKQIYLISSEDVNYDGSVVQKARANNIVLNFVTNRTTTKQNMKNMARETNGVYFELQSWNVDNINFTILENNIKLIENYLKYRDSDRDGLYDVYEEGGMLLSNGEIVYSDPGLVDSDEDEISDFVEVGGLPEEVIYKFMGKEYLVPMFKGALYEELSDEFIFVDGTPNKDGTVINDKMDYVPYSQGFHDNKYKNIVRLDFFNETRRVDGAARVHNSYADKKNLLNNDLTYLRYNNTVVNMINLVGNDPNASRCYYMYYRGDGGKEQGCLIEHKVENDVLGEYGEREYLQSNYLLLKNRYNNDMYTRFQEHLLQAQKVAESVLNEYNTEAYISTGKKLEWKGCEYGDFGKPLELDIWQIVQNIATVGIYNVSNASMTLYCTYDLQNQTYTMEYIYYLNDYYDFTFLENSYIQDALGCAKGYELFGVCPGVYIWEKGKTGYIINNGL